MEIFSAAGHGWNIMTAMLMSVEILMFLISIGCRLIHVVPSSYRVSLRELSVVFGPLGDLAAMAVTGAFGIWGLAGHFIG